MDAAIESLGATSFPPWIYWSAVIVAGLIVLMYGLAPLVIWLGLKIEAHEVVVLPLGHFPPEALEAVSDAHPWLRERGFEFAYSIRVYGGMAQDVPMFIWSAAYESPAHGRGAALAVPVKPSGTGARPGTPVLIFCTNFDDGTSVQTQLDPNPTVLPKPPRFHELHVWGFDRDELLRLHIARENRRPEPFGSFVRSDVRCLSDLPNAALEETLTMRHSYEELVDLGAMRRVGPISYGLTFARSFHATWLLLFPVKQLVRWRTNRRARRLLDAAFADAPQPRPAVKRGLPRYFESSPQAQSLRKAAPLHDREARAFVGNLLRRVQAAALDAASSASLSEPAPEFLVRSCGFEGCPEDQIAWAESVLKVRFTDVFRAFLREMGSSAGPLFAGFQMSRPVTFVQMRDWADGILQATQPGTSLPPEAVVLLSNQGKEFMYVLADGGADSPVFAFSEANSGPRQIATSFAAFLEERTVAFEESMRSQAHLGTTANGA